MSALKQACERSASAKLPRRADRIELELVERKIAIEPKGQQRRIESWRAFLTRIGLTPPALLKPKDLRRLVEELWDDEELHDRAAALLDTGVARTRKSIDRTIIGSYLKSFPADHPAFDHLTHASAMVANRHDWPWRERGRQWELWNPDVGPLRLSRALLASDEPANVLRDAGLDGDLATGEFVKESLVSACEAAAGQRGDLAVQSGRRLIALFERFVETADLNAALAYALLSPWTSSSCSEAHQRLVSGLLVSRVGDPRLQPQRWAALRTDVLEWFPGANVDAAFAVLRGWLVRATVREFFSVVAKTVERRDQWKERTDFWMAYLDAGMITDAWFAFGASAERMARSLLDDRTIAYAKLEGTGATSAQSALLFTIGDLRISEWSDNGRCRFWKVEDRRAPPLYQSKYFAAVLRAMDGGPGFDAISHNPPNGWQAKFARHVYRVAGLTHPKHGVGW